MAGLNGTLEIAKKTLLNTQIYIQTTSHNIANADNKAYARQKVVQVTGVPQLTRAGWLGMGASVERILQQRDDYIEQRLLESRSKESLYDAEGAQLRLASGYLADDGESGISGALGKFWNAWDALNQNPSGASNRTLVQESARHLAESIRTTRSHLENQAQSIESEIQERISKAGSLLADIANYNKEISLTEFRGEHPANDLRDKRYEALLDLADLLPINYEEETDGSLTVTLPGTSPEVEMVKGNVAATLAYDGASHVMTVDGQPAGSLPGGEIEGLVKSLNQIGIPPGAIPADPDDSTVSYLDRLNAFASSLISEVNTAHGSTVFSGSTAADIQLDNSFVPDGSVALEMAELQHTASTVGTQSFDKYLASLQNRIGLGIERAENQKEFYASLHSQMQAEQQSISGVSIDEEMVDLLKNQQIYQAAAKIVQHTAEMLNAVINMV
jgi:flagellar hook-associated protein FlgK